MEFFIECVPIGKQSFRFGVGVSHAMRPYVQKYKPKDIREYEDNVRVQVKQRLPMGFVPWTGPVIILRLIFEFPPLKTFPKKKLERIDAGETFPKTTKPDIDNLLKPFFDAIEGLFFRNDAQVCEIANVRKRYGKHPGIYFEICEVNDV